MGIFANMKSENETVIYVNYFYFHLSSPDCEKLKIHLLPSDKNIARELTSSNTKFILGTEVLIDSKVIKIKIIRHFFPVICKLYLSCPGYQKGRKEMFYLRIHSTHFIYGYMVLETWTTLLNLQQGFFYMHHPTDMISYTMAFVTPVVEHWLFPHN